MGQHSRPMRNKRFQSAPLTDVRGDIGFCGVIEGRTEFQSAPLTDVRGDHHRARLCFAHEQFQSAPLTDVRGDKGKTTSHAVSVRFQSAPLTDVRGDAGYVGGQFLGFAVSIRSPHGCKGRCCRWARDDLLAVRFNPLPSRM